MQAADGAEARDGHGEALLCPAAVCEPGAVLVGMVGADGRVGYVLPQVPVSERFVAFARTSGAPERRFRFASPCIEGACRHWCDGRCGLYLHPNVWHGALVPLDDEAQFLDRQGRVHARVSVNFVKEFGCYLGAPLRRPWS